VQRRGHRVSTAGAIRLKGEIRTRRRHNLVHARSFAELLEQAIRKYQNRAIETAQVIVELIGLEQAEVLSEGSATA
jgi:type I restriction enzyme R subunit